MKRRDFVRHLEANGFILHREGGRHSIYAHPETLKTVSVPRHTELKEGLIRKICRDAEIADPFTGRR